MICSTEDFKATIVQRRTMLEKEMAIIDRIMFAYVEECDAAGIPLGPLANSYRMPAPLTNSTGIEGDPTP
jgi:hypothetical protein